MFICLFVCLFVYVSGHGERGDLCPSAPVMDRNSTDVVSTRWTQIVWHNTIAHTPGLTAANAYCEVVGIAVRTYKPSAKLGLNLRCRTEALRIDCLDLVLNVRRDLG